MQDMSSLLKMRSAVKKVLVMQAFQSAKGTQKRPQEQDSSAGTEEQEQQGSLSDLESLAGGGGGDGGGVGGDAAATADVAADVADVAAGGAGALRVEIPSAQDEAGELQSVLRQVRVVLRLP